jgi:hypothetical protein
LGKRCHDTMSSGREYERAPSDRFAESNATSAGLPTGDSGDAHPAALPTRMRVYDWSRRGTKSPPGGRSLDPRPLYSGPSLRHRRIAESIELLCTIRALLRDRVDPSIITSESNLTACGRRSVNSRPSSDLIPALKLPRGTSVPLQDRQRAFLGPRNGCIARLSRTTS